MLLFISISEIAVILLVAFLLFGTKKIPEFAKGLGKGYREFQKAADEVKREIKRVADDIKDESNTKDSDNRRG